jgi:hypothetical protein
MGIIFFSGLKNYFKKEKVSYFYFSFFFCLMWKLKKPVAKRKKKTWKYIIIIIICCPCSSTKEVKHKIKIIFDNVVIVIFKNIFYLKIYTLLNSTIFDNASSIPILPGRLFAESSASIFFH